MNDHIPLSDDGFAGTFEDDKVEGAKDFALTRVFDVGPPGYFLLSKKMHYIRHFHAENKNFSFLQCAVLSSLKRGIQNEGEGEKRIRRRDE